MYLQACKTVDDMKNIDVVNRRKVLVTFVNIKENGYYYQRECTVFGEYETGRLFCILNNGQIRRVYYHQFSDNKHYPVCLERTHKIVKEKE